MDPLNAVLTGISVNTQSSVRLTDGTRTIYVDPLEIPGEPRDADAVFVTHAHGDHFSPADIAKVAKKDTVLILPETMADRAGEVPGIGSVLTVNPDEAHETAGIFFETVPAYNHLPKLFHPKKNRWVGYVIALNGVRVWIAGDTDATPEAEAVKCDVAMVPVGGKYTMTAKEAADLVNRIRPAAAVPTHYGSIVGRPEDGALFLSLLDPSVRGELRLG